MDLFCANKNSFQEKLFVLLHSTHRRNKESRKKNPQPWFKSIPIITVKAEKMEYHRHSGKLIFIIIDDSRDLLLRIIQILKVVKNKKNFPIHSWFAVVGFIFFYPLLLARAHYPFDLCLSHFFIGFYWILLIYIRLWKINHVWLSWMGMSFFV